MATKATSATKTKEKPKAARAKPAAPKTSRAKTAIPKPPSAMAKVAKTAASPAAQPTKAPVVDTPQPIAESGAAVSVLTKRELITAVAEKTGMRRNQVKPAIDACMEVMGQAVMQGRGMKLPHLGKIKPQRTKQVGDTKVTVAKIRQNTSAT